MSGIARVLMDVSYTRTQRVNVGITRTVRRLEHELRSASNREGMKFVAVSYHSRGFREIPHDTSAGHGSGVAQVDQSSARLFRWLTGAFVRTLVRIAARLPPPVLRFIWSACSSWAFDFLSRAQRPVDVGPDDLLLLCDASWNFPAWKAVQMARKRGTRIAVMIHDLMPLRHPQFCFPLVPPTFELWLGRMLPLADCIICNSAATRDDLRQYAVERGLRLPPTSHFRLGSDPVSLQTTDRARIRPMLREFLNSPAPCFAAIGSLEPKKNHGFLLDVFERLWLAGHAISLLIIGRDTGEWEILARRIRVHPEQGRKLLWLSDGSDDEVAQAYANCRALVFPSLAEGFGLPLVEARTRGALVVASSLPVFVELADAGVSIYPQGSHEALERLVIEHAREDRRMDVEPMKPFTWADSSNQLLERVRTLLPVRRST